MKPEFGHTVPVGRIDPDGTEATVEAGPAERSAVANRLGLVRVEALACGFRLVPHAAGRIEASGRLRARVVQTSVLSLEPFEAEIAEDFTCAFVPAGAETDEIDPESDDELPYAGNLLDLGEAATEQLALALDPYPRAPGEEMEERGSGSELPFARLAGLRRQS